jgi:hypothetical protein
VAASGDRVVTAGGTVGTAATRAVFAYQPANRAIRRIATLPKALTHSSAASLHGTVFLLGGRGPLQGTQTRRILAIDPGTGRVRKAGRLPRALSDAGAAAVSGAILIAGGRDATGPRSDVTKLVPR